MLSQSQLERTTKQQSIWLFLLECVFQASVSHYLVHSHLRHTLCHKSAARRLCDMLHFPLI